MRNTKLLLLNTTVLTLSGFLMRTIAVAFNVYLTGKIGAAGIGLFQLIMAVYGLVITFASAGIKLGATRLVTDSLCGKGEQPAKIMGLCIRYALTVSLTVTAIFYMLSGIISRQWIMDERACTALKILALSLPPIAVSAAMNGYFTARKTMVKYAGIQLIEQLCKIAVTVLALSGAGKSLSNMCSALAFGTTASEFISCLLSCSLYLIDKERKLYGKPTGKILTSLLHVTLPDSIGSGMRAVLLTVEHLLIPIGFKKSGQSAEQALTTYGTIHGMALPIILYPAAVLTSLSSMLVPELSRCLALKKHEQISSTATDVLRMAAMFSFGAAGFMLTFAKCISTAVYENTQAEFYIKLLSILLPVMYMDTVVDGMLKGLDQQLASMRYNIIDSGLCVALVYILLPKLAIKGYIFILFLSEIINFALSIGKLIKITTIKFNIMRDLIKPCIAAAGSSALMSLSCLILPLNNASKTGMLCLIIGFTLIYCPTLLCLGCISKEEFKLIMKKIKG